MNFSYLQQQQIVKEIQELETELTSDQKINGKPYTKLNRKKRFTTSRQQTLITYLEKKIVHEM